ncbi:MAG: hypothetical protein IPF51_12295 [Dehalococcoidia bacterium]|uniref:hypothetical protein n=1 Tax=Candidatus Amarobacter glycogenicus TaxID=3140699 RepID=UPI00313721EF|nr:hypothetical protein [Dehalococcoidia bacterium]
MPLLDARPDGGNQSTPAAHIQAIQSLIERGTPVGIEELSPLPMRSGRSPRDLAGTREFIGQRLIPGRWSMNFEVFGSSKRRGKKKKATLMLGTRRRSPPAPGAANSP